MKVSGLTILREARRLGYPFEQSLRSLLPLVDELVVVVGEGDDGTWESVGALGDARIAPVRTRWADGAETGSGTLSVQTNRALERCTGEWALYLQADEVLHQDDYDAIRSALRRHRQRRTEALAFDVLHFFGSPRFVQDDWRRWYRRAVRAVKTGVGAVSVGDAAGFRKRVGGGTRPLLKARAGARIFHYGWCEPAEALLARKRRLAELFDEVWTRQNPHDGEAAELLRRGRGHLVRFDGTHPAVMGERLHATPWHFDAGIESQPAAWRRHLGLGLRALAGGLALGGQLPLPLFAGNAWRRLLDLDAGPGRSG